MIAWLLAAFASLASANPAPPARSLRVVTYNIQFGKGGLAKIIDTLRSVDADLVALEEVDRGSKRAGGVDQLSQIAGALSLHSAFAEHLRMPEGPTGVALLSRWPIKRVTRHVGPGRLAALDAYVEVHGQSVHVLVVHFFPTGPFESGETKRRHDDYRRREAEKIAGLLSDGATLVLGDFNDDSGSPSYLRFSRRLRDACRDKALDKTWPSSFPMTRIDYIWLSPHFEVKRCDALSSRASDHRPVRAEIHLLPAGRRR